MAVKQNRNKNAAKRVIKYILPYKKYIAGGILCSVVSVGLTLLGPVLTGAAIDNIISAGNVDFAAVGQIIGILSFTIAGVALFQWMAGLCANSLSYNTAKDLRRAVFLKFNHMPLSYIDTHPHGDLISRIINDVEAVGDGILQLIPQLFSGVVTILGTIIIMVVLNYQIAIIVIVLTPLSLFAAYFIGRFSGRQFRRQQQLQGEISGYAEEYVGNQKLVKTFLYEDRAQKQFEQYNQQLYTVGQKAQFAGSLSNPTTRFVNTIVYIAVGIFGSFFVIDGLLTIGQLSSFLVYANQYTKPFNEVTGVLTQLQTALASAARVFQVIDEPNEPEDKAAALEKTTCRGNVSMENISFAYRLEQKLIQNFTLHVKAGERIAIVGPTGCGKTTLINLLMAFYTVNTGKITIDGTPISDITRNSLRKLYAMVLQESWLLNATVAENIRYSKPNATNEEVVAAAKAAYAHGFIRKMEKGYDTVIAEQGGNLSQGQKQLLCIARAMISDSPMLILDEATSSIDTLTEIRVQKAFKKMMAGKTCFVVAHRLSTIKESDTILVMKDGNIIEQGDHDTLIEKNGFYAKLYNSQFVKE